MTIRIRSLTTCLLLLLLCSMAYGEGLNADDLGLHGSALRSLQKGAHTEAIQQLELLADRGVLHPDISFDRAVAYAYRARSPQARPGDFGRAAFALSEVLALRPDDTEAAALLTRIDLELSRARSRRGNPSLLARPRLTRAVVGLLPENVWAVSAMVCSLATTLGILYRFGSSRPRRRLAGAVTAWLSAALLAVTSLSLLYAVHARHSTRQGVVVTTDARLVDITGVPVAATQHPGQDLTIPEGAKLVVTGRTERLLKVEWGSLEAYVSPSEVQLLPQSK